MQQASRTRRYEERVTGCESLGGHQVKPLPHPTSALLRCPWRQRGRVRPPAARSTPPARPDPRAPAVQVLGHALAVFLILAFYGVPSLTAAACCRAPPALPAVQGAYLCELICCDGCFLRDPFLLPRHQVILPPDLGPIKLEMSVAVHAAIATVSRRPSRYPVSERAREGSTVPRLG
jgi:hypothetical protein